MVLINLGIIFDLKKIMYMYYFDLKTSTFPISPHLTSPTIFKLLVGETSCTGLGGEAGEELDEKELWAAPRTSEGRRRLTPHLAGGQPRREQSQSIPAQNPGLGTLISNAFHDDS